MTKERRALLRPRLRLRAPGKIDASSEEIPTALRERKEELLGEMKILKEQLLKNEERASGGPQHEWQLLMVQVPNIPDPSVPDGDRMTLIIKRCGNWGPIAALRIYPKSHVELMQALGMADFERGAKVAGFRGYFLKGDGALLNYAVWNFVLRTIL